MAPDERALRTDLARGPFRSGAARRRWRFISIGWPHTVIAVSAAERPGGPAEYAFRFNCEGYPQVGPTAEPWDVELDQPLAHNRWPTGKSRIPKAFNSGWNGHALYLPCDRLAILGHEGWLSQHPHLIWSADKDITHYLGILHELLNSSDYTGPVGP